MTGDSDYQFHRGVYSAKDGCVYIHRHSKIEPELFCTVRAHEPKVEPSASDRAKAVQLTIMLNELSNLSLRDKIMRETGVTPGMLDAMFEVASYRERLREIVT